MTDVSTSDHSYQVELRDLVIFYWKSRWSGLVMLLLSVAVAATVILTQPTLFTATISIARNEADTSDQSPSLGGGLGGILSLAGVPSSDTAQVTQSLFVMQSRGFLEGFIEEQGLLPVMFADMWDADEKKWILRPNEKQPALAHGVAEFLERLSVAYDEASGIVELTLEWPSPDYPSKLLNALVRRFNLIRHAEAQEGLSEKQAYIQAQLEVTEIQAIRTSLTAILERQIEVFLTLPPAEEFYFVVLEQAYDPDPDKPAWPNKSLILLLGGIGGVFLWAFVTLVRLVLSRPGR